METLPAWLQWLVSLATILSSIGVIIAFVQLRISSKQFNEQLKISAEEFQTQLKLTQDQFKLINQGFVKMSAMVYWLVHNEDVVIDPTKPIPLDLTTQYFGGRLKITLENVGNLPVKTKFKHFIVFVDDKEMANFTEETLVRFKDTIHPKTHEEYSMPDFPFRYPETGLHLAEIANLKITYSLLIEYKDYNDTNDDAKTIERELEMVQGVIYNAHIYDKL